MTSLLLYSLAWFVVALVCFFVTLTPVTHVMTALGLLVIALNGDYLWLGLLFMALNVGARFRADESASPYFYENSLLSKVLTAVSVISFIGIFIRIVIAAVRFVTKT
jgi:hypothetical protein